MTMCMKPCWSLELRAFPQIHQTVTIKACEQTSFLMPKLEKSFQHQNKQDMMPRAEARGKCFSHKRTIQKYALLMYVERVYDDQRCDLAEAYRLERLVNY